MVQLVEVEDEHFQQTQPGPEEEDDYSDTGEMPTFKLRDDTKWPLTLR